MPTRGTTACRTRCEELSAPMTTIAAVRGTLPPHRYHQNEITDMFAALLDDSHQQRMLRRLHASAQVEHRNLVLPLERYAQLEGFGEANDEYLTHAVALGSAACEDALEAADLSPADVDAVFFTTVTGIAAPSVEARIANRIGLRPDVKRVPMFGLGCVAGAAGIARLHDYLRGAPGDVAVLVSVELCSLTFQRNDRSMANLVGSGLFGDGAAAVVAVGDDRKADGPRVIATRSHLYPDTERTMGWDVTGTGLQIVLDADVPRLAHRYLGEDVRSLLGDQGLTVSDVSTWVSHPGGPKVIEAIEQTLDLGDGALELTWRSLADIGNLSSSSVLHVLRDTLDKKPPPGTPGMIMAMGPGFCSELVLVEWT